MRTPSKTSKSMTLCIISCSQHQRGPFSTPLATAAAAAATQADCPAGTTTAEPGRHRRDRTRSMWGTCKNANCYMRVPAVLKTQQVCLPVGQGILQSQHNARTGTRDTSHSRKLALAPRHRRPQGQHKPALCWAACLLCNRQTTQHRCHLRARTTRAHTTWCHHAKLSQATVQSESTRMLQCAPPPTHNSTGPQGLNASSCHTSATNLPLQPIGEKTRSTRTHTHTKKSAETHTRMFRASNWRPGHATTRGWLRG